MTDLNRIKPRDRYVYADKQTKGGNMSSLIDPHHCGDCGGEFGPLDDNDSWARNNMTDHVDWRTCKNCGAQWAYA